MAEQPQARPRTIELLSQLGCGRSSLAYYAQSGSRTLVVKLLRAPVPRASYERLVEKLKPFEKRIHPVIQRCFGPVNLGLRRVGFAVELCRGQAVNVAYARLQRTDPQGASQTLLGWFEHACDALGALHKRRLVHGNLKASNIIVAGPTDVRLLDPGWQLLWPDPRPPSSWAPEQRRGLPISASADLWSLAQLLCQLMPPNEIDACPALKRALRSATRAAPDQRSLDILQLQRAIAFARKAAEERTPPSTLVGFHNLLEELEALERPGQIGQAPNKRRTSGTRPVIFRDSSKVE